MKVYVEFVGLPALAEIFRDVLELEITRGTIEELVSQLVETDGAEAADILLDDEGKLDDYFLVVINGTTLVGREEFEQPRLREGDRTSFILPAGGG